MVINSKKKYLSPKAILVPGFLQESLEKKDPINPVNPVKKFLNLIRIHSL
jgi:hypothetical protein